MRQLAIEDLAVLMRHERIAFQYSGGRDSTAALFLLREYWPLLTVYHLDTGDQFPETKSAVAKVQSMLIDAGAEFVVIQSDVHRVRAEFGLASDLVPADNTSIGRLVSGRDVKIIGRYDCCVTTIMRPAHERLIADRMTLIVRGQRDDEYATQPLRSGDVDGPFQVLYPIQSWSAADVDAYLESVGAPVPEFYARGMRRAPECMGCTAWWDEGRAAYLKQYHPEQFKESQKVIRIVREEIARQYDMLDSEV